MLKWLARLVNSKAVYQIGLADQGMFGGRILPACFALDLAIVQLVEENEDLGYLLKGQSEIKIYA